LVFLRAGRHVVEISYEDFERWVREGRVHSRVEILFEPVTGKQWVRAGELEMYRSLLDDERARFQRQFSLQRFPYVTFVFVVACIAYWAVLAIEIVQRGGSPVQLLHSPRYDLLVSMGAKEGAHMIELGQWWRLLTFSFLHAGLIHLVPNMLYTAYVGWSVEAVYGRSGAAVIFFFSAIGCGLVSLMAGPIPSVGASGVTFGLFAASVVFGWKYEPLIPEGYTKKFGWAFFPFFAVFLIMGFRSELVDNWGHVGGVIGGGIAAFALVPAVVQNRKDRLASAKQRSYIVVVTAFAVLFGISVLVGPRGLLNLPRLNREVVHDQQGMSFKLPGYWTPPPVYDRFPYDAYTSPSKAMAVSYGAAVQEYPIRPGALAGRFIDEIREAGTYEVLFDTLDEEQRQVGPEVWRVVTIEVQDGTNQRVFQRAVTWRGCVEFRLTFQCLPKYFDTYSRLREGILESATLTYPSSILEGEKNLRVLPDFWELHSDLGRSYAIYGAIEEAESELLRAREMAPEMYEPLFWLLFLYDRYDLRSDRRRELVDDALTDHGSNGDMLMLCYEVCRQLEDRPCAGKALAMAHESYPHLSKIQKYIEEFGGEDALPGLGDDDAEEGPEEETDGTAPAALQ